MSTAITAEGVYDAHATALGFPTIGGSSLADYLVGLKTSHLSPRVAEEAKRCVTEAFAAAIVADHRMCESWIVQARHHIDNPWPPDRGVASIGLLAFVALGSVVGACWPLGLMLVVGVALEMISGHIANLATLTALTLNTGDSLTVRSWSSQANAWLLNTWAFVTAAGITEIRSPRMHDNVHNLRYRLAASQGISLMPLSFRQRVYPVDTLTVQLAGDATAGRLQPQSLLLYYEDVPGIAARMLDVKTVLARMINLFAVEVTVTLAVTGDYSAAVAINANFDQFIAGTDYAVLGYVADINTASIQWKGVDTGNVRVGGPGTNVLPHVTGEWFVRLSTELGLPLIPVFNANNKAAFNIDALMSQAGGTLNVSTTLAQLKPA